MTDPAVVAAKQALRRELRARRRAVPHDVRHAEAARTVDALRALAHGRPLASYLALAEELDLDALHQARWQAGLVVWLPRVQGATLAWHPVRDPQDCPPGAWGVREPDPQRVPAQALPDEVVMAVPGVAFDRQGGRLGLGKGFYDRVLAQRPTAGIGIGFACQEVPEVPREAHDQRLPRVILGGIPVTCP